MDGPGCPGCFHIPPPHAETCSENRGQTPCWRRETALRDVISGQHRRIKRLREALEVIEARSRLLDAAGYARSALAEDGG